MNAETEDTRDGGFDYIIVGSGAGGAPLASRLARELPEGKKVLVIEAGSSHTQRGPRDQGNEISRVPLLHAASSEHPDLAWRFFVNHYQRDKNGNLPDGIPEDPKWHKADPSTGENENQEGIFYPRAAGIGGCTIHNAMITITGPDSDWDEMAGFLGDPSWSGRSMRAYFQRLEHNDYQPVPDRSRRSSTRQKLEYIKNSIRFLVGYRPDTNSGRHGFDGWLHTSFTDLSIGLSDKQLVRMLKAALWQSKRAGIDNAWSLVRTFVKGRFRAALDPNHAETLATSPEGIVMIPLAVHGQRSTIHQDSSRPYAMLGRRSSPREILLEASSLYPDKLTIWTDCLVTKVLLDDGDPPRAIGVELKRGARLYRAHINPSDEDVKAETIHVRKDGEVILCGGAFNTPQLLMLSGIGERSRIEHIESVINGKKKKEKVPCRVDLRGVGRNLQDRYEVTVVSEMERDFSLLDGATFTVPDDPDQPDRHLRRWREEGTGLYTSNGGVLGIFKRSSPDLAQPDLFIFGVPSDFRGYKVGYSKVTNHNLFTWVILKAHSKNRDGQVNLRSTDPRDTPLINFNYFNSSSRPGESATDPDIAAIQHAVTFVRGILSKARSIVKSEVHPGSQVSSASAINEWIRRDAWGHHACGTCRMGPDGDDDAVLDSRFCVRKMTGLRVVDASIFPKIPGYFIVSNIYMAAEKAADVILEDERNRSRPDSPAYPLELRESENIAITRRREQTKRIPVPKVIEDPETTDIETSADKAADFDPPQTADGEWNQDVTGLALSGGGIRSATLCLGVIQNLARRHLLRRVDFLSTVSGGGYIGSCVGRFFDRQRGAKAGGPALSAAPPADHVEKELITPGSPMLQWLRSHGNYIAPHGSGDLKLNLAVFLRNLLSLHLVVGLALFAIFGIANLIRYGLFERVLAGTGLVIDRGSLPIGHLVESLLGPWFSPWFIVVELLLLFLVLPRMLGYWIVSQDEHETFKGVPLVLLFFVSGLLLWIGVSDGLRPEAVAIGLAMLSSLIHVEMAWKRGRASEAAVGTGGAQTQRQRTRNYLTYDLGLALGMAGVALGFTVIDTLAHGLQEWRVQGNITYARAFAGLGAAIMAITPLARWLAGLFGNSSKPPSSLARILKRDIMAGALAVILFTLPLVFYSFASFATYDGGKAIGTGFAVTLLACVLTAGFALPSALTFVNRSSLAQTYAARLARAYLGASNPERHRPAGMNVTEVIAGDDVASIRDYRPHEASGPLHMINVTINQTVDYGSRMRKRDRQGLNMAVSCLGVTVGERWHSKWTDASSASQTSASGIRPAGLEPIDRAAGSDHPLVDELDRSADRVESLSLRQWMAISGAAVDPGRGQTTNRGTALLTGMVNLRTGHWWDSGIAAASRGGFPRLSFIRRFLYLVPRYFATQSLILFEWLAHFPGPWQRFWHLSDGGFFENLACYELIRRRVPRIIVCDGGADPAYQFSDFAELVRKVRIDFDARIESFTAADLTAHVPPLLQPHVGTFDDLLPPKSDTGAVAGPSQKHAALFWVHYPPGSNSRRSVLLLLKASVTGDEPADVENYHGAHQEFPHESTADQFFDEAQWESYRKLGEHSSGKVFAGDWFWHIPLPASDGGPA